MQLALAITLAALLGGLTANALWGEKPSAASSGNESSQGNGADQEDEDSQESAEGLTNKKIVALGDSFTYGYPVTPEKSWTQYLAELLQISVVNKGLGRQTAQDMLDRFERDVLNEQPGRVIIFAGNGDILQGVEIKAFQENIIAMIAKAKENEIIPVLALPLPYKGYVQTALTFRKWEQEYAQTNGILLLDFSTVLFDAENDFLPDLSGDGKYPTVKGYKLMGEYAAQILK